MNGHELIKALNELEKIKGIDKELIFGAITTSLEAACKKNYGSAQDIRIDINRETGDIKVFAQKTVVDYSKEPELDDEYFDELDEEEYDDDYDDDYYDYNHGRRFSEISLEEAREIDPNYNEGDIIEFEIKPDNFDRMSAQTAKQVVIQKLREAEKLNLYQEYSKKDKDIDTAIVQRADKKDIIVSLGKMDARLPLKEQIPGEVYRFNDRIKVFIYEVKLLDKGPGPIVNVSRTHNGLVKRLFELEVPEVMDGTVEIKGIAREAGSRTKMAVYSKEPSVDAVGACVGPNGTRVNVIVNELKGEKIDIVPWDEDPKKLIAAALNPSKVIAVEVTETEDEKSAKVVVPDSQLSLAIGKEGQNVRLAARLTGWKIDIKSESQAKLTGFADMETEADEQGGEEE